MFVNHPYHRIHIRLISSRYSDRNVMMHMIGSICMSPFNGYTLVANLPPSSSRIGGECYARYFQGLARAPVHFTLNYMRRDRLQHPTPTACMCTLDSIFNYVLRDQLRHPTSTSCTTSPLASKLYHAFISLCEHIRDNQVSAIHDLTLIVIIVHYIT